MLPTDVNPQDCGDLSIVHDDLKRRSLRERTYVKILDIQGCNNTFYEYIQSLGLSERAISVSQDDTITGPGQEPSYALLMRAVINGDMAFQYPRLVQISEPRFLGQFSGTDQLTAGYFGGDMANGTG